MGAAVLCALRTAQGPPPSHSLPLPQAPPDESRPRASPLQWSNATRMSGLTAHASSVLLSCRAGSAECKGHRGQVEGAGWVVLLLKAGLLAGLLDRRWE